MPIVRKGKELLEISKCKLGPKEKPNIIVITVGGRKGENKESRDSKG